MDNISFLNPGNVTIGDYLIPAIYFSLSLFGLIVFIFYMGFLCKMRELNKKMEFKAWLKSRIVPNEIDQELEKYFEKAMIEYIESEIPSQQQLDNSHN